MPPPAPPPTRPPQSLGSVLRLALFWLVVFSVGGELAARLLLPEPATDPAFEASPDRSGDPRMLLHGARETAADGRSLWLHRRVPDARAIDAWFALPKAADELHLGCVGGSVMAGKAPHQTLCAGLAARLAEALPTRQVRFINEGQVGSPSWKVAGQASALLQVAELDLLVVHSVHNDFLLDRHRLLEVAVPAWLEGATRLLRSSRLVGVFTDRAADKAAQDALKDPTLDPAKWRMLRFGPRASLRRSADAEAWVQRVVQRYGESIEALLLAAEQHGVPVVLIEGARNPADREYLESVPESSASPATVRRLAEQSRELGAWIDQGRWDEVEASAGAILAEHPRYAAAWQAQGMALRASGDPSGARVAFTRANDEAGFPSAGTTGIRERLRRVAGAHGAPVGRAALWLDDGHGLPDPALFLDDVHPTQQGHQRLADGLFELVQREGLLPQGAE